MGIPRLFKRLTDRYPSLQWIVEANQLPNYDYLYIDLNFLLHKAVTERGFLPLEQADDEYLLESRIFERVLRQIETLHRIIPSNVLFLAIDGVAPRAKWTTQKNRRAQACEKSGIPVEKFDTNAISPGTVFMLNFEKVLLEFIAHKMVMHKNWQNCDIYVSGSNVPGEGSIKIIDFIRNLKHSNGYVPNETHCIYSGDNDYILLGIATHELYISYIQEPKKSMGALTSICSDDVKHKFSVIHFELLRQYLRMEFVECKMSFEFSMDRIVDDWVMLMTLIGNDYLPGLPKFDLDADILSTIYDAYKQVLAESNDYMTESGILNVRRFTRLLYILKPRDFDLYCDSINRSHEKTISDKMAAVVNLNDEIGNGVKTQDSFSDFLDMKYAYYDEHLGQNGLPDFDSMSASYVKTVQWILFYYFRGTVSWNHYYPYTCAPFVSDFSSVQHVAFTFDMDKPVNTFTHLLAILPKRSSHLLPTSYQSLLVDDIRFDMNNLILLDEKIAEECLDGTDESRNQVKKNMIKLQYIQMDNTVKTTEILLDKKLDRVSNEKDLDRPLKRNDFNFMFSTLNLHHFSSRLVASNSVTSYPRMVLTLESEQFTDLDCVAKKYLNEIVYVDWPHFLEAKIVQIFNAEKKFDCSGDEIKITENPPDFNTCVESLKARYTGAGIDVGEIEMVAFVAPLKWVEYIADDESNKFKLVECWNTEKWQPCAIQTISKRAMADSKSKELLDAIQDKKVFLFGGKSHYGEMATIISDQVLETNGRVNILAYKNQDPNFGMAINLHQTAKANKLNECKQASSAAALLGISERVFARITGTIFVHLENAIPGRKINIGLQLKYRNPFQMSVSLLHDYVKNVGTKFIYSQKCIDLVQQYMDHFPRVFEVLSNSDTAAIPISDFDENNNNENGFEYIRKIREWLRTLPHSKERLKPIDLMHLSDGAIREVRKAVTESYTKEPKMLKLKMKWQNLYIPDMNNVYVVPCSSAVFKLLDRIVIVRSGYPFDVGAKGTVIGIEPKTGHIHGNDVTDFELFALEILMDDPYRIKSNTHQFKKHRIFRTRSTNMMINLSHGRAN